MITDPTKGVTVAQVQREIAEREEAHRFAMRNLRALLRVLEHEEAEKGKKGSE